VLARELNCHALLFIFVASLPAGEPGRVSFQRLAAPSLDRWTNSPSSSEQEWFRDHFARMGVFSPYFDKRTAWYRSGLLYVNLYGIPRDSQTFREHPEWVLRDSAGEPLYIPWGCAAGTCPQYAGDIVSPLFRKWWISKTKLAMSRGSYLGLWIDDVNMEFRVSNGNGQQVIPQDSSTQSPMTWEAWRGHVADFLEQIRHSFPESEIVHNSIWFAGPATIRDRDYAIQRQISSADNINIERGIASDPGLTGGKGQWSVYALFSYIDRVHAAGKSVTLQEYSLDPASREYALAGYFLISLGNDRLGDGSSDPSNWWSGYDVWLGTPGGPRTYSNGIFRRSFSHGLVLLAEPNAARQEIRLERRLRTLDGNIVSSITLGDRQGVVLTVP
jgi:hypothetical protein